MRAAWLMASLLIASGTTLHGQSAPKNSGAWQAWGSLGLMSASVRAPEYGPRQSAGGHLSVWATYDRLALSLRSTSIPIYTDETSGIGDQAILAGVHLPLRFVKGRDLDLVVAAGGGRSFGIGYLVPAKSEGMFAASAQLNFNYRIVGIGIDALADVGPSRRFVGTGVSFALGWFR